MREAHRRRVKQPVLLGIAAAAVVLAAVAVATLRPSVGGPQPGDFRVWLREVRGDDADRGWDLLNPNVRADYGRKGAYLADVASVDWAALRLADPVDVRSYDGFVLVEARLRSAPDTVPRFLFERRIVHGVCDPDGVPIGVGVYEDRRPFAAPRFDASGLTGYQRRCNEAFHPDS